MLRQVCVAATRRGSPLSRNEAATFLRFFSGDGDDNCTDDPIRTYLEGTAGIDPNLHKGILKAMASVYGRDVKLENIKAFGDSGLQALAASVAEQVAKRGGGGGGKRSGRCSVMVRVKIPHHSTEFDLEWKAGDSLVDLADDNDELLGEYMEGTCGQNMSCCTCHVYIDDDELRELLPKPERSELDMLVSRTIKKKRIFATTRRLRDLHYFIAFFFCN
jgi:ferredoxin